MPKFKVGFALLGPPVILSLATLAGWFFDTPLLTSGIVSGVRMNPATALCFLLLSLEAVRMIAESDVSFIARVGKCAVWLVIVVCIMRSSDYLLGTSFDIDAQLFSAKLVIPNAVQPNRMAPNTTACFLALGSSLLLLRGGFISSIFIAQGLAAVTLLTSVVAIADYLYHIEIAYRFGFSIPMAINTAVSFAFLSGSLLVAIRYERRVRFFSGGVPDKRSPATTIYAKILFNMLIIAILPLGVVAFYAYQRAEAVLHKETQRFLDGYADKQTKNIDNYIQERLGDAHVFSKIPSFKEAFQKIEDAFLKGGLASPVYIERTNEFLPLVQEIVKAYGYINLYLVSIDGDVIFGVNQETLLGTNLFSGLVKDSDLPRAVKMALETKSPQMSKLDFYPGLNGQEAAYIVTPIFQGEKVIGVLILRISPDNIYKTVKDVTALGGTGETIFGLKIGNEVVFVANTRFDRNPAHKMRFTIGKDNVLPMQNAVLEQNGSGYLTDYRGHAVLAVWRYLPSIKMGMVVKIDIKEIDSRIKPIWNVTIIISLLALLLTIVIARRIAKSIARPIEQLTIKTRQLASGQIHQIVDTLENNEIGALADAYNIMATKLEESQAKILTEMDIRKKNADVMEDLYNQAPCGYHSLDKDGIILQMNNTELALLGYAQDEVVGKIKWVDLLTPLGRQTFQEYFPKLMAQGYVHNIELEIACKDGTVIIGLINATAIYDASDNFLMSRASLVDITEQKQAEKNIQLTQQQLMLSEKLAGIGQLSAGVCHEILNPLNIISMHTQLLMGKRTDDPVLQEVLTKMRKEVQRIVKIVSALMGFARKQDSELKYVQINSELDSVLALLERDLFLDNIKIDKVYAPELPELWLDADEMRQIFINMLNNAKHAMKKGGVLTVRTEVVVKGGCKHVRIKISDTGYGIKKENLNKIFDPFFTTKPEGEGTGMGLSVSHTIIEKHHGTLAVESKEGEGATFIIDLPF